MQSGAILSVWAGVGLVDMLSNAARTVLAPCARAAVSSNVPWPQGSNELRPHPTDPRTGGQTCAELDFPPFLAVPGWGQIKLLELTKVGPKLTTENTVFEQPGSSPGDKQRPQS
jgi:hypothetical protein